MLRLESRQHDSWLPATAGDWTGRSAPERRRDSGGPSTGLLIAGVVVVGLGILTWSYLGPDLRRYMKIHSM
ncbi:MAG: DUF6893 family small protein [Isosphaeraceae bacterium]